MCERKELHKFNPPQIRKIFLVGGKGRIQTEVTPKIRKIAAQFPGSGIHTVKDIADFVFRSTPLREDIESHTKRFGRKAEEVLKRKQVDLLHCYDRCHAMISLLTAKEIPAWMVVELDWQNYLHAYVETMLGNKLYTIAFRTYEPPLAVEGQAEESMAHAPGSTFVRGRDIGDLGVTDPDSFKRFVEQMGKGKITGSLKIE